MDLAFSHMNIANKYTYLIHMHSSIKMYVLLAHPWYLHMQLSLQRSLQPS